MNGKLYLCSTPIGNLEDISYRTIRILKNVDLIAVENTKHSIKLLNYFHIKTHMTSYYKYNEIQKSKYLIKKIKNGKNIALITNAGTPMISDPGKIIISKCINNNIKIIAIPGPVACITALILSGFDSEKFIFESFLPSKQNQKIITLKKLKNETRTIILYEAPHRIIKTLKLMLNILGNRKISICKELTKKYENIFRTTLIDSINYYNINKPKGEYVLILSNKIKN